MFDELKEIKVLHTTGGYYLNSLPGPTVPLDELYKSGWWITEIFGSTAVLVSRGRRRADCYLYFRCVFKTITVENITPAARRVIKRVRTKQWNKYKKQMLTPRDKRYRIYQNGNY